MSKRRLIEAAARMLARWARRAESDCHLAEGDPALCCYGPGYRTWGVQANWNYAAALATLAARPGQAAAGRWRARALAALRFALATHVTGRRPCPDGQPWGRTWISMLGIERAMHGVAALERFLSAADRAALRRMLVSEAQSLLEPAPPGGRPVAGLWAAGGRNVPESNIWKGCLLWRTAQMFPREAAAAAWKDRAHDYFANGVSLPADAASRRRLGGRTLRERHAGANFFPHFALDHHGYLNVGYMAICVSNVAMLHFDLRQAGLARPAALDHHQAGLWSVLRRMLFADGRLARIGGDSRVRYAYCQEYLLPALLYAADRLRDGHALELVARRVAEMEREQRAAGDGSFYGARLGEMRDANPHYYTRLESDRAAALAMLINYLPLVRPPPAPRVSFERSVAGEWAEPEHGAVLSRCPTRFASLAWRAYGLGQALCLPPGDSSLAEWDRNLSPLVVFLGTDRAGRHRRLLRGHVQPFPGGFAACGAIMEGVGAVIDEGAHGSDQAVSHQAFAALPDGRTCLGLQYVVSAADRVGLLAELQPLHLNVPNDLFNHGRRVLRWAGGGRALAAPARRDLRLPVTGRWLNVDNRLGVVALFGGRLLVDRAARRRGGAYCSLGVEEIGVRAPRGLCRVPANTVLADIGFAVLASCSAAATASFRGGRLELDGPLLRGAWAVGRDGKTYLLAVNFGAAPAVARAGGVAFTLPAGRAVLRTLPAARR